MSVTNILAPLAPIGCPSATAPPFTLTFCPVNPNNLLTASETTANASFISKSYISEIFRPDFFSTLSIASAGAVVNSIGALAAEL